MRLIGWPTNYTEDKGLTPIYLQDVDIYASADELRSLASFLMDAAAQLEQAQLNSQELNIGIDFDNEYPNAEVGIWIGVIHHKPEL